jgi:hypothetical protein
MSVSTLLNQVQLRHTVSISHSPGILVLHEHVAELEFRRVQILARDEKLRESSAALGAPVLEDVVDLRRKFGLKSRKFALKTS